MACGTGQKGFTLLEVMVALSIIAVVFVSVFNMHAGTIDLAETEKFYAAAPSLAAEKMALIGRDMTGYSGKSGGFGEAYSGYGWRCEIDDAPVSEDSEIFDEETKEKLKKITLEVTAFDRRHVYRITTWRYSEGKAER